MKISSLVGIFMLLGTCQLTFALSKETEEMAEDKDLKASQIYVGGNLYNAAVSHEFSKTYAASNENISLWNSSTGILNTGNNDYPYSLKGMDAALDKAGVPIYTGGNASNNTIDQQATKGPASENDKESFTEPKVLD